MSKQQQQILFDNNNHYSNGNVYDTSSSSINIIQHNNSNNNCNNHTGTKNNLEDFIYQLKQRNEEVDIDEDVGNGLLLDNNGQNVDDCSKTMELYINNDNESTLSQSSSASNHSSAIKLANNNHNEQSSRDNLSIPYDTNALLVRLAKKEKDLILAAELGKALLDRNEELSRTNEQLNEEYTKNIEVC